MTKETITTQNLIREMRKTVSDGSLWVKKRHQTAYSAGEPDIAGVLEGKPFFIEVKRLDGELTALQAITMEKLSKAGAYVGLFIWVKDKHRKGFLTVDFENFKQRPDWAMLIGKVNRLDGPVSKFDRYINNFLSLEGREIIDRVKRFYA